MVIEVFLAALGGGMGAGVGAYYFGKVLYDHVHKPDIKIKIKSTEELLRYRELEIDGQWVPIFRLGIMNVGKSTATNCVIKLRSYLIEDTQEKEEPKNTLLHWHRNPLYERNGIFREFTPVSIAPNEEEWVDLFFPRLASEQDEWQLHFISSHPVHCSAGKKYRLIITVYGDNVHSDDYSFRLYWDVHKSMELEEALSKLVTSISPCK